MTSTVGIVALLAALWCIPGWAQDLGEMTVTGKIMDEATANRPAVVESITAEGIERINAMETSDVPNTTTANP